jgi:hypothetical protein
VRTFQGISNLSQTDKFWHSQQLGKIAVNKTLLAIPVMFMLGTTGTSYAQKASTKDQFVGTWKVVELKTTSGEKVSYPLGERPDGYVSIREPDLVAVR